MHNTRTKDNRVQDTDRNIGEDSMPFKYQCLLCKKHHYYKWQAGPVFSSRRLARCPRHTSSDPDQMGEALCKLGGCRLCRGWMNNSTECTMCKKDLCRATTTEGTCSEWHNCNLHTPGPSQECIDDTAKVVHSRNRDQIQKEAEDRNQACSKHGAAYGQGGLGSNYEDACMTTAS